MRVKNSKIPRDRIKIVFYSKNGKYVAIVARIKKSSMVGGGSRIGCMGVKLAQK